MLPVIIGKSKTVVTPIPSNLLLVGGSFTGRLKIYDRDTLQEVTLIYPDGFSGWSNVTAFSHDAEYIYVGGYLTNGTYVQKINKSTGVVSGVVGVGVMSTNLGLNGIVSDNGMIYTVPAKIITPKLYRLNVAAATAISVSLTKYDGCYNLAQSADHIYFYTNRNSVSYHIFKHSKIDLSIAASLTLSGSAVRSLTVDSNFLYFGSTTSGDFHVYDLDLTTEQTGYPTVPGSIYSILNDDTNVYIGSSGGNVYVINKATKALTTTVTSLGANIISLSQTSDLLYAASAAGIVKIGKSNLSTVYSVLNGLSSVNTIMVI